MNNIKAICSIASADSTLFQTHIYHQAVQDLFPNTSFFELFKMIVNHLPSDILIAQITPLHPRMVQIQNRFNNITQRMCRFSTSAIFPYIVIDNRLGE